MAWKNDFIVFFIRKETIYFAVKGEHNNISLLGYLEWENTDE